jgi:hypothetical protein
MNKVEHSLLLLLSSNPYLFASSQIPVTALLASMKQNAQHIESGTHLS